MELMIVVVIMGILVRIALPGYHSIQLSARAAQALGEALLDLVGESTARFTIADHYTFIIAST